MTTLAGDSFTLELLGDPEELGGAGDWNVLAGSTGSPFLTVQWLTAWWRAFGAGRFTGLVLRDGRGSLRAGACCRRLPGGRLAAAANAHTGDWDVVASDPQARRALWQALAGLGAGAVQLPGIRSRASLDEADAELRAGGYSTARAIGVRSPYLELPATWEELLASVSRNHRSQLGRRRRALEREGRMVFRTCVGGGEELERDLAAFFRVEGSGWKSGAGTAILSDPRTERLYTDFARAAAAAGWLRLHLLELDGVPVAADLDCAFAGGMFLIKTGFDERYGRLSPGLVLRGEVLRAAVEEGARFYDFLGGPDSYKLRWTTQLRPRAVIRAYRGPRRPLALYHARLRPVLKAGVVRARELQGELARRRHRAGGRDDMNRRWAGPRRWLLLVAAAGLLAGCQSGPDAGPPTSTVAGRHEPAPIRFSGQKATRTEPFLLAGGLTVFGGEHRGRGSFRVEILNEEGEPQRVLFLATGPYRGSTGLGLQGGIYRLSVAAGTSWNVEITQPRDQAGAALPVRYQGASDTLVGPVRVHGDVQVEVEHDGEGDLSVELLSDQGPSLYFLVEASGRFKESRTAAGLEPGAYYLNVEARQPWRLTLQPG